MYIKAKNNDVNKLCDGVYRGTRVINCTWVGMGQIFFSMQGRTLDTHSQ